MYYINFENEEYCRCSQRWNGEFCYIKSSKDLCNKTSCSPNSECIVINYDKEQIKCICPLGKSGNQCYITYNPCEHQPCKNNGICLPIRSTKFSICLSLLRELYWN